MDSTRIMVRCKKKMEWKSRELLYNLYMADTVKEVNMAFRKCNENKVKEKKIKPFDIEKVYEKVDTEVNGAWQREVVRKVFNNMFNEFFVKKVGEENHINQPKEWHKNFKIATNYLNKRSLLNL